MGEFPFQLSIKSCFGKERTESLTCTGLLRVIPGRRFVYEGVWDGIEVIVKVFSHKISARRHLKREWRALNTLHSRGLSSPAPFFCGSTAEGGWAVVMERIADSESILHVFNKTADKGERINLLVLVCKELAKQHSKGVLQKDLHMDNFLIKEGKIFTVDPTQMRFSFREIGKRRALSQLALLSCSLAEGDRESIRVLLDRYGVEREWSFDESDLSLVEKKRSKYKAKGIRKTLKKSLRTSKRTLQIGIDGYRGVFERGFCEGAEPIDFIRRMDELMDCGEVLKNGNTCYVSRLMWNNKDVAVKRYNHKGIIHSLRHTIKGSRARRGWLYGHLLLMLNIGTPRPLAYVEQRKGGLLWQGYLATEYVRGQNLDAFLRNGRVSDQQRTKMMQKIDALFAEMAKHHIIHRDLKHSNIIVTENGPTLIDLDALKVHKLKWCKINQAKAISCFRKRANTLLTLNKYSI